jgi:hypothetical protein
MDDQYFVVEYLLLPTGIGFSITVAAGMLARRLFPKAYDRFMTKVLDRILK